MAAWPDLGYIVDEVKHHKTRLDRHRAEIDTNTDKILNLYNDHQLPTFIRNTIQQRIQDTAKLNRLEKGFYDLRRLCDRQGTKIQALEKSNSALAARVDELTKASTKKCRSCSEAFQPQKSFHIQCKDCHLKKRTIPCRKCKKSFTQQHHTHRLCSDCAK